MRIKWLGYASFLITSKDGVKIINDPYQADPIAVSNAPITETADIVTISHGHFAVNYVYDIRGLFQVYNGRAPAIIKGIKLHGVATYHGLRHGINHIICMEIDGLNVCHLGDLGHTLSGKQLSQIGRVDILIVPADDCVNVMLLETVHQVIRQINPKVIIPMRHFILEEFCKGKQNIFITGSSEVEFTADTLPASPQIVILKPAL